MLYLQKLWEFVCSERSSRGVTSVIGILTVILLAAGLFQIREVNLNLERIDDLKVAGDALFQGVVVMDDPKTKGQVAVIQLGDETSLTSYGCISLKVPGSYNWVNLSPDLNSEMKWTKGKCE